MLQCVAGFVKQSSNLDCAAGCCSVLQCVAVCCSVSQGVEAKYQSPSSEARGGAALKKKEN